MKTPCLVLIAGLVCLAGCTSVPPPETARVVLVGLSSNSVSIVPPKLILSQGQLMLDGYVTRQLGAFSTGRSHLDIVYFDGTGHELRTETINFWPRELAGTSSRYGRPRGRYRLPIPELPSAVVKIEVRAHDEPHQS